ncbi:MAG: hypothetical protein QG583_140 [Patescibacteria group bacterium]|nr:hypothetical protein [Patescibacteria group bacterium]
MQNNFFGSKLNSVLLLILIVLMIFALRIMLKDKATYLPVLEQNVPARVTEGKTADLVSFSILPNTEVSGILSYRGSIKGAWFFEANIQINILDANKNVIKASNAVAKTEWMTVEPVEFEGNIDFTGLTKGPAYFEIHNDNPSGLPENDKFIQIPIIIK